MSQQTPIIGNVVGAQYRTDSNNARQALMTQHKGATAPTYTEAGTMWLDDTATPWILKMYDGADWIVIGAVNATTNKFTPYFDGAALAAASETVKGLVERATDAEVVAGTDTTRYITAKQFADNMGSGGKVLGQAYTSTGALISTTSLIPFDDTIPQNTEGAEILTLAYTPVSATSKLIISLGASWSASANNQTVISLFKDAAANAISAMAGRAVAGGNNNGSMVYEETSGSTTARTYKMRMGVELSNTLYVNGRGGSRLFGGVAQTYIKITEIEV